MTSYRQVWEKVRALETSARSDLLGQGFKDVDISCQAFLNLRFQGTDTALMTPTSVPTRASGTPGPGDERTLGGECAAAAGSDPLRAFFDQYRYILVFFFFFFFFYPCFFLRFSWLSLFLSRLFCFEFVSPVFSPPSSPHYFLSSLQLCTRALACRNYFSTTFPTTVDAFTHGDFYMC